ncbi:MAG: ABC transporter permease [Clostridiales bacterium]|nr:ABC transporter permease [Clostridiales bacterium]
MEPTATRLGILRALLRKEMVAYSRDKLYLFLTLLTLVFAISAFWIIPDSVDETVTLAVAPPVETLVSRGVDSLIEMGTSPEQLAALTSADLAEEQPGLRLLEFESKADLAAVIEGSAEAWRTEDGEIVVRDARAGDLDQEGAERVSVGIGVAFPETFIADVARGAGDVTVTVYSDAAVPEEIESAVKGFVREAAFQLAGEQLPVEMPSAGVIVLGKDRMGDQVSMRDKLIPMLAFMILLMETFSMASLISVEVLRRTVTAVLVTPARIADFLAAKSIFGTGMALVQGVIVLALLGAFTAQNWWLLVLTVLLGSMMFTGVAMIVGAAGKDFLGQLFYAMVFTVPLIIPAASVLFPGTAATWVQAIPTYPVLAALVDITIYDARWAGVWHYFAFALAWVAVLFGAGLLTLKRKVESL